MIKFSDFIEEIPDHPKVDVCKGLVFRAYRTQWFNCNGIGQTVRLKLLKRKSCTGCEHCDYYQEFFDETNDIEEINLNDIDSGIYIVSVITESGKYSRKVLLN